MPSKQRRQQPPLQTAIKLFVAGTIALILAVVIPVISVSCSYEGSFRFCIETRYYGLDARTFGIVLGILSVVFFAGGIYYLMRHKQTLVARRTGTVFQTPQQFVPQQPGPYLPMQHTPPPAQQWYPQATNNQGAYPPMQNTIAPGSYTGDAPFQPPSRTFPQP